MQASICRQLQEILGREHVLTAPEDLACYSFDGTGRSFQPEAVIFPDAASQVSEVLCLANRYRFPVTPRGAGSGMTGGALPVRGGVVLVTSRMNRIVEIDRANMVAVVEPGVITGELQNRLAREGLLYPVDPASLSFCTIGGNAAECAGGPSAVKYGVTRDHVLGLQVVLPTGEIMETGVRTGKGVVGYDLTRLFIGSEGTLGIFTRLVLRLLPQPESRMTFLLLFDAMQAAPVLVSEILAQGMTPCTLEYMDAMALAVVRRHLPLDLPESVQALLLLELDGSQSQVADQAARLERFLREQGVTFQVAADSGERDRLWLARRSISPAVFALRPHKISEDVVVPRSRIHELVEFTSSLGKSLDLTILTFGHAGDGNIHVNIMLDREDRAELARATEAKERLFEFVLRIDGTLSGEHGIGITKSSFLSWEIDPVALEMMRRLKNLFDPNGILNPGKIFPQAPSP